jgi:pyruvate/2-oxoacid:ferredoxin oxidoreductase beta subunit
MLLSWFSGKQACNVIPWFIVSVWYDMIYLLTAVGLTPGGSSIVHIYTQTVHRPTQNNNRTTQITINFEECEPWPVFESFTLAFALHLRKKHGKTSVRVRKTSVRVQSTHYQNTHTLQNLHTHTHTHTRIYYKTHTYTHTLQNLHTHTHTHTHTNPHITKPTHTHTH